MDTESKRQISFFMQIGLMREHIIPNVEADLSMSILNDLACAFVDRKVRSLNIILSDL